MADDELIRLPIPPIPIPACNACGASDWAAAGSVDDSSDAQCRACGTRYSIENRHDRRLRDDGWHTVQLVVRVSLDGTHETPLIAFDQGRDDQRPDHDPGAGFYRPICVAEHLWRSERVYTYHFYCGACRRRIGSLGEVEKFCPRCGKGIAHYVFADGIEHWSKSGEFLVRESIPDVWSPDL